MTTYVMLDLNPLRASFDL